MDSRFPWPLIFFVLAALGAYFIFSGPNSPCNHSTTFSRIICRHIDNGPEPVGRAT